MIAFLGGLISLLGLLFGEFFSAQARARQENKEFQMNDEAFQALVQAAVLKMRANAVQDTKGAGDAWDAADQDAKKDPPGGTG